MHSFLSGCGLVPRLLLVNEHCTQKNIALYQGLSCFACNNIYHMSNYADVHSNKKIYTICLGHFLLCWYFSISHTVIVQCIFYVHEHYNHIYNRCYVCTYDKSIISHVQRNITHRQGSIARVPHRCTWNSVEPIHQFHYSVMLLLRSMECWCKYASIITEFLTSLLEWTIRK